MSEKGDLERRLLEACREGELDTVRGLVESKVVNPNTAVDSNRIVSVGRTSYIAGGWTPLHHAAA